MKSQVELSGKYFVGDAKLIPGLFQGLWPVGVFSIFFPRTILAEWTNDERRVI